MKCPRFVRAFCLTTLLAVFCHAQEYRGAISGVITDATGAVVPEAVVRTTNSETNTAFTTKTTSTGVYSFSLLEPGTYSLRAEAAGFKPVAVQQIQVHTAEKVGLNLSMQ